MRVTPLKLGAVGVALYGVGLGWIAVTVHMQKMQCPQGWTCDRS
jgi:hypothetical protein